MADPRYAAYEKYISSMSATNKKMLGTLAPFIALPMFGALVSYYMGKKSDKAEKAALETSLNKIVAGNSKMRENSDKAVARFNELAYIAPSVARNPVMAEKFLASRLDKGLSIDDIHKLSVIQASGMGSQSGPTAAQKALLTAGNIYQTVALTLGRDAWHSAQTGLRQYAGAVDTLKTDLKKIQEEKSMNKKSSPNKLSDECVGEMLADRYIIMRGGLLKEATSKTSLKDVIRAGGKAFARGAAYMAPALALGGVIHGTGMIVDAIEKRKLSNQADDAFAKIKKNSDIIKGDPDLANEALDAIKTFAPSLAAKPAVLKTFIEHTVRVGSIAPQTINDLSGAQSSVSKSKAPGFASGFVSGLVPITGVGGKLMPDEKTDAAINKNIAMSTEEGRP